MNICNVEEPEIYQRSFRGKKVFCKRIGSISKISTDAFMDLNDFLRKANY